MHRPAGRFRCPAAMPGLLGVFLLLWPILAAALDPSRAITQYRPDRWTRRDGLPQMSVLCLLQDRAGYLWIGMQEGLARFDGVSFRSFKVEDTPALASNYVSALFQDRRGRIWIGTDTGELSYFDGTTLVAAPGGKVLRGLVLGFAESPGGDLFVAFRGAGLQRLAGDRLEPVADHDGRPIGQLGSFAQGPNGEIWAGGEGRLFRFAGGRWTRFDLPGASGRLVTALAVSADGEVVLNEDGPAVRRFRPNGAALEAVQPGWELPAPVRSLFFDRDRTLWVATESGVARRRMGPGAGLEPWSAGPGSSVNTFFEDREGGFWIGTNSEGLLRLRADEVVPLGAAEGLPHDTTWNVMEASDGALWVTTDGGLARIEGGRVERVSVPGLPGSDAVALAERRDGSIWVGTYRYGVFRLPGQGGPAVRFTPAEGVPAGAITVIFEDSRGRLWIGSREGLAVESGERFDRVRLIDGDVQPYVAAIVEGREGTVWIATNVGLFAQGPGGRRRFGSGDGLADTSINAILLDREGRLWTATNGQGIQVLDDGRFRTVDRRHGLPTGTLTWVVEDDLGGLWFSTNQGLLRADRQALLRAARGTAKTVELRHFGLGDGMLNEECAATGQPSATRARDGRVWFATGSGLVAVDPSRLTQPVPPPPALEALVADGRVLPLLPSAAPVDLASGHGDVEIRFTALSLDEAAGTRFRYRLTGYDDAWIEADRRRSAFYTRLPPGSYGFEVQALHEDGGAWSAPVALSFRLRPHAYQTVWFRSLLVAAAGLALYGGIRWRSWRLERRAAELALANENLAEAVRRAELEHREAERHAQEARRAAAAKGAFLATVSHELRTPLNGILGCCDLLLRMPLEPRQRELSGLIRTSGDTLLSLVNQILDLAQSDRGKLALVSERFWVPECFEEAVEVVANAAETKGLDLALSIDAAAHRYACGDRTRLREIATNLLANAVKFTASGGVLAEVRARVEEGGLRLELKVSDTGVGIAPEDRARIFEPFEQVDTSFTRRHGGSGLGLAIASRLCAWMQGTLSVESELGKGAVFTATVRLDLDPASDASREAILLDGHHVLISGLSGQTRVAVEQQLRTWGALVSSSDRPAGEVEPAFTFGITAEPGGTLPDSAIPWIRVVSPNTLPTSGCACVDLLRPVRPSRLAAAILKALVSPAWV